MSRRNEPGLFNAQVELKRIRDEYVYWRRQQLIEEERRLEEWNDDDEEIQRLIHEMIISETIQQQQEEDRRRQAEWEDENRERLRRVQVERPQLRHLPLLNLRDRTYREALMNGTLTQEEYNFVQEQINRFDWFDQDRYFVEESIPLIEAYARNHPNVAGILGDLIRVLRNFVLPHARTG
jgi:hypothetical protein